MSEDMQNAMTDLYGNVSFSGGGDGGGEASVGMRQMNAVDVIQCRAVTTAAMLTPVGKAANQAAQIVVGANLMGKCDNMLGVSVPTGMMINTNGKGPFPDGVNLVGLGAP